MLEEERHRILTKQKQRIKELQKLLTTRAKAYDSHESLAQMSKSRIKALRYHERTLTLQITGFQTFFFHQYAPQIYEWMKNSVNISVCGFKLLSITYSLLMHTHSTHLMVRTNMHTHPTMKTMMPCWWAEAFYTVATVHSCNPVSASKLFIYVIFYCTVWYWEKSWFTQSSFLTVCCIISKYCSVNKYVQDLCSKVYTKSDNTD